MRKDTHTKVIGPLKNKKKENQTKNDDKNKK